MSAFHLTILHEIPGTYSFLCVDSAGHFSVITQEAIAALPAKFLTRAISARAGTRRYRIPVIPHSSVETSDAPGESTTVDIEILRYAFRSEDKIWVFWAGNNPKLEDTWVVAGEIAWTT